VRYSLGDRYLDPFREALDIGRGSRVPVHVTHFYHRTTSPGGAARMLGLIEDARDEGLDVTFDSYPTTSRRRGSRSCCLSGRTTAATSGSRPCSPIRSAA